MSTVAFASNVVFILNRPAATIDTELHTIRAQAALVRSLLDELEYVAPPRNTGRLVATLVAQTAEELAQLASKMMVTACSIAPQRIAELQLPPWPVPPDSAEY